MKFIQLLISKKLKFDIKNFEESKQQKKNMILIFYSWNKEFLPVFFLRIQSRYRLIEVSM